MLIEEIILIIQRELSKKYGFAGLTKIALEPKLYDTMIVEFLNNNSHVGYSPSNLNPIKIMGVEIHPRSRDDF